jgi:hypothetical protein
MRGETMNHHRPVVPITSSNQQRTYSSSDQSCHVSPKLSSKLVSDFCMFSDFTNLYAASTWKTWF